MLDDDVVYDNGFFYGMSWFGAFRNHYGFTAYGDFRTQVTADVAVIVVLYFCGLLCVATLVSTLGIRGRERWSATLRASYAVGLATIILVCQVGHNWQEGSTKVSTQYIYRTDHYFEGTVGVRVALHGVNVTLEGYYGGPNGGGYAYYAEDVKWADYGKEREMISYYLDRGLPHPILTVMDFLSIDEGGLRFGRNFHSAGYFSSALLWTAFAFWIIASVLLLSVVSYGAFMFFLTGATMVTTCVVYHVCQPPRDLQIHFGETVLYMHYGWCFWLTLAAGILTTVLGFLMFTFDHLFHEKVAGFFHLETLDEDDLPDLTPANSTVKQSDPLTPSCGICPPRRFSLQPMPGKKGLQPGQARKGSIFLDPERQPNDYSSGVRKGNLFANSPSLAHLGIHNKAFEKERYKSNPLFSAAAKPHHIEEVDVAVEKGSGEVRIDIGGDEAGKYGNRKPSLATMREHRENHINERQQKQTTTTTTTITTSTTSTTPTTTPTTTTLCTPPPTPTQKSASDDVTCPTEIIVHCPSDESIQMDDVAESEDAGKVTSDQAAIITVGFAMNGSRRPAALNIRRGAAYDCTEDSGIVTANASPMDSEQSSSYGDHDE